MNVNIKAIKKDKTGALIESEDGKEKWINFAEWIKPNFVKIGPASVTIKEGLISFCKMVKEEEPEEDPFADEPIPGEEPERKRTKLKYLKDKKGEELTEGYNTFAMAHKIIATQIFPTATSGVYDAFIYYQ